MKYSNVSFTSGFVATAMFAVEVSALLQPVNNNAPTQMAAANEKYFVIVARVLILGKEQYYKMRVGYGSKGTLAYKIFIFYQ
jgi:hypothetical protein